MARIPDAEIERLKDEVSLVRLVESAGVKLAKRGGDMVASCPFHDDTTPSFVVTVAKNLFNCFGCGAAGGPIDWVMKRQGVSFRHAVELLRDGAALDAPASSPVRATVRRLAAPVSMDADDHALLGQVVDYYHETLKGSAEGLAYLKARGLEHPELVERFRLGLADRTLGLRLPEKNRKAGAEIRARLERIGVYRASGHEHFTGSLVVPVLGEGGVVTEVYGRKIRNNLRAGTPMHLYLPGPHRGVWNLDGVAAARGEVILAESLIDAMTLLVCGVPQRDGCLWHERRHRRPSRRFPRARRRAGADCLRPRRCRGAGHDRGRGAADEGRHGCFPHRVSQGHGRERLCACRHPGVEVARRTHPQGDVAGARQAARTDQRTHRTGCGARAARRRGRRCRRRRTLIFLSCRTGARCR